MKKLMITIKVKLTTKNSMMPTKAYAHDRGYDLYSLENTLIPSGDYKRVLVGTAFEMPKTIYAEIVSRSSQRIKGIIVPTAVIDSQYKGEVGPIIYNLSNKKYVIKKGDKIAQILFKNNLKTNLKVTTKLYQSQRGNRGFGSSNGKEA